MDAAEGLSDYCLGATDANLLCTDPADSRLVVMAMIAQAERSIDIFGKDLDPLVFNDLAVGEAIEDMILRNRRAARIRIVVREPWLLVQRGHCLLNLRRRLPSFIELRTAADEHQNIRESFFIADGIGILHRPYSDSHKANANFCEPAEARRLSGLFADIWEFGQSDPNFRSVLL